MTNDIDRTLTNIDDLSDDFQSDVSVQPTSLRASAADSTSDTEVTSEVDIATVSIEELTDRDTGLGRILHQLRDDSSAGSAPTGGDVDTDQYQSKVSGEEAVGGTTPTPDQNVVEDLAISEGIATPDEHPLRTLRMMQSRDAHRWELEPESAEDYPEHSC